MKETDRMDLLGRAGIQGVAEGKSWTKYARGWKGRMQGSRLSKEMTRRKISEDGHEIIDKATYAKLTKSFLNQGGIIIRGDEARRHLERMGAYASYMNGDNIAFIRDDATVSDVIEEMYHARQDRAKMYTDLRDRDKITILREIDAQKYLIASAQKYKIPIDETDVTRKNLAYYEACLDKLERGE